MEAAEAVMTFAGMGVPTAARGVVTRTAEYEGDVSQEL
jgi:hypothetical protein